ncbi:hypothetical protein GOODEAATRI_029497, partial [Goodea atripinnis]
GCIGTRDYMEFSLWWVGGSTRGDAVTLGPVVMQHALVCGAMMPQRPSLPLLLPEICSESSHGLDLYTHERALLAWLSLTLQ